MVSGVAAGLALASFSVALPFGAAGALAVFFVAAGLAGLVAGLLLVVVLVLLLMAISPVAGFRQAKPWSLEG